MNIFVLDTRANKCARAHCDKHVVKMLLESAQLLSTAVQVRSNKYFDDLYRPTHVSHPCSIWVRETSGNFYWLSNLAKYLCAEYTYRYGKIHASAIVIERATAHIDLIPAAMKTPFIFVGPDKYKDLPVDAGYREYYKNEKRHMATWRRREEPKWFTE